METHNGTRNPLELGLPFPSGSHNGSITSKEGWLVKHSEHNDIVHRYYAKLEGHTLYLRSIEAINAQRNNGRNHLMEEKLDLRHFESIHKLQKRDTFKLVPHRSSQCAVIFATFPNRFKDWIAWIGEVISSHSTNSGSPPSSNPKERAIREDGWLVKHSDSGGRIRCSARLEYCTLTLRPKKIKALSGSEETINLNEFGGIERLNTKDTFRIIPRDRNGNSKMITFSTAPSSFEKWTKAIRSAIINHGYYELSEHTLDSELDDITIDLELNTSHRYPPPFPLNNGINGMNELKLLNRKEFQFHSMGSTESRSDHYIASSVEMKLRALCRKMESMERVMKELQTQNARKDEEINQLKIRLKQVQDQTEKNNHHIHNMRNAVSTQRLDHLDGLQVLRVPPQNSVTTSVISIATFLERVHLPELAHMFMQNGYGTLDDIVSVQWDHDKLERLGIHKMGHRDKLLLEIQRKREQIMSMKAVTTNSSKTSRTRTGSVSMQTTMKHPKSTLLELCQRYERAMPKETVFEEKEQNGIKWWEATVEFEATGMQKQRVTAQRTKKKEAETACFRELLSIYLNARNMVI